MESKTIIITGANAGIGKETALSLAKTGARIIMACRNMETGKICKDEIVNITGNTNVVIKKIDLSSFQSIRSFAEDIKQHEKSLDILIHNAGVWLKRHLKTDDNLDMTMKTNHFGPFLLTHLLIDLLKKSSPSRIIILSSVSHFVGRLHFDESQNYIPPCTGYLNYFNSKFANICFANELANRLKSFNITVNSVHPGLIKTEIWNSLPPPFSWPLILVSKLFFKTPQEGCQTTVYLATSNEVENVSGKYFVNCKQSYVSKRTRSVAYNKKFWDISIQTVHLKETDPKI
ncbi:hypothetical protein RI129_005892 [Pyrocoelia pectoralis]|uniref:Retinol dehydrogenase 14 n=1 Tax=Pyrocoelia pectoralis TaxID=417401 RepID=A0AAN7VBI4_9COLE